MTAAFSYLQMIIRMQGTTLQPDSPVNQALLPGWCRLAVGWVRGE